MSYIRKRAAKVTDPTPDLPFSNSKGRRKRRAAARMRCRRHATHRLCVVNYGGQRLAAMIGGAFIRFIPREQIDPEVQAGISNVGRFQLNPRRVSALVPFSIAHHFKQTVAVPDVNQILQDEFGDVDWELTNRELSEALAKAKAEALAGSQDRYAIASGLPHSDPSSLSAIRGKERSTMVARVANELTSVMDVRVTLDDLLEVAKSKTHDPVILVLYEIYRQKPIAERIVDFNGRWFDQKFCRDNLSDIIFGPLLPDERDTTRISQSFRRVDGTQVKVIGSTAVLIAAPNERRSPVEVKVDIPDEMDPTMFDCSGGKTSRDGLCYRKVDSGGHPITCGDNDIVRCKTCTKPIVIGYYSQEKVQQRSLNVGPAPRMISSPRGRTADPIVSRDSCNCASQIHNPPFLHMCPWHRNHRCICRPSDRSNIMSRQPEALDCPDHGTVPANGFYDFSNPDPHVDPWVFF